MLSMVEGASRGLPDILTLQRRRRPLRHDAFRIAPPAPLRRGGG